MNGRHNLEAQCPVCGASYPVLQSQLGQQAECEACGSEFRLDRRTVVDGAEETREPASPVLSRHAAKRGPEALEQLWSLSVSPGANPESSLQPEYSPAAGASGILLHTRTVTAGGETGTAATSEFELLDVIGQGGMGVVYRARQTALDRPVAVKMLRDDRIAGELAESRFLSEAAVTGALDHPNIVPVHDLGTSADGRLFYAMREVKGHPWSAVLRTNSLSENLDVLLRVCDAVAFAHANGVLHRDLKPANVMLGDYGEVLVVDWGLAVSIAPGGRAPAPSAAWGPAGTPCYMAPEMASCEVGRFGPSTDVYLLGGILYEIVTGRRPHAGRDVHACLRAAVENHITAPDGKGELLDIALRAMATDPSARYATAQELQQAIRGYRVHAESHVLTSHARDDLTRADQERDYQGFAQALFGFREAAKLWVQNEEARQGEADAVRAYATCAYERGDYDLAISLLESAGDGAEALAGKAHQAKVVRQARQRRLRSLSVVARALAAVLIVVLSVAFVWVRLERNRALLAQSKATEERKGADAARQQADEERARAVVAKQQAEDALAKTTAARAAEEAAKRETETVKAASAQVARNVEEKVTEKFSEEIGSKRYLTAIHAATQSIRMGQFDRAEELLWGAPKEFRGWEWGRLLSLCHQSLLVVGTSGILAVSPDGMRMARRGAKGIEILDTETGERTTVLSAPASSEEASRRSPQLIRFSRDGARVAASARSAGQIWVWDARTGALLFTLDAGGTEPSDLALSHSGKLLAVLNLNGNRGRMWDCIVRELGSGTELVRASLRSAGEIIFSPDDQFLVAGARRAGPKTGRPAYTVVTVASGAVRECYPGTHGLGGGLAFSADGTLLAMAHVDGCTAVWDFRNNRLGRTLDGSEGSASQVAFSPDGLWIATGGEDEIVRVWRLSTGQLVRSLRGHVGGITAIRFLADRPCLMTAAKDSTVRFWDLSGEIRDHTFLMAPVFKRRRPDFPMQPVPPPWAGMAGLQPQTGPWPGMALSPKADYVVGGRERGDRAHLWNASNGTYLRAISGHPPSVSCMAFSGDGRCLATGAHASRTYDRGPDGELKRTDPFDNTIRLWSVETGREDRRFVLPERTDSARAVALSLDGRFLGAVLGPMPVLRGSEKEAVSLASPPPVAVWKLSDGTTPVLLSDSGYGSDLAFSPDSLQLLTGGPDGWKLWNPANGELLKERRGKYVGCVAFSPTGSVFATGSNRGEVQVWDARAGSEQATLKGHEADRLVADVAFSPDGRRIVTTSLDKTVRVWDSATGQQMALLTFPEAVSSVGFSADGCTLATSDGTLWHAFDWHLTKEGLEDLLRRRYAQWRARHPRGARP